MVLTKVRLNTFVLLTTLFGYLLASLRLHGVWVADGWMFFHTLLGTGAAALGSAAFNQLMEIEQDRKMKRTADRPLPTKRMSEISAFGIGWMLSALGVIHLGAMVNTGAAYLAALTIAIYVFVYTPMKRSSSLNTLVGAVPGAIPPVIGWAGAGGSLWAGEAWYLFALLFLWQLPHFVAINWLCRVDYEEAGYVMWSNGDESGKKTAKIALFYSVLLALLPLVVLVPGIGYATLPWVIGGLMAGLWMCWLAVKFGKEGTHETARKLFYFTLLYLPLSLALLAAFWEKG